MHLQASSRVCIQDKQNQFPDNAQIIFIKRQLQMEYCRLM